MNLIRQNECAGLVSGCGYQRDSACLVVWVAEEGVEKRVLEGDWGALEEPEVKEEKQDDEFVQF